MTDNVTHLDGTKHLPIDEPHMIVNPHRDGWQAVVYQSGAFQAWPRGSTEGPQDPDTTGRRDSLRRLQEDIDRADAATRKAATVAWNVRIHLPVSFRRRGDTLSRFAMATTALTGINRGTGKPKFKIGTEYGSAGGQPPHVYKREALMDTTPKETLDRYLEAMRARDVAEDTMNTILQSYGVPLPEGYGRTSVETANEMMEKFQTKTADKVEALKRK